MWDLGRRLGIVLGTALASLAIIYFSIPMGNTEQSSFDVILVLGTPMREDGTISPLARARVLEAVRQYRAKAAPHILMSGGAAHNSFSEARGMADFAQAQGVPAAALFIEDQSRNTIENAHFSYRVMQARGWESVLVVSSASHLRRAALILRYYPVAWKMQAAPWPREVSGWLRLWIWSREVVYTSYVRIFGFPGGFPRGSPRSLKDLPRTPLTPPRL